MLAGKAVGGGLEPGVAGGVEALGDAVDEGAHGGLAPEPGVDVGLAVARALGHAGLVAEGLEVVGAVADKLGHGHVGGAFVHVGVVALGVGFQEADDAAEASLGDAGDAHGGAAALFLPALVIAAQGGDLVGRVEGLDGVTVG